MHPQSTSPQPEGATGTRRLRIAAWSLGALILLVPAVVMQFTDEVNWGPEDFGAAAVLVLVAGTALEFTVRKSGNTAYRLAAGVAIFAGFALIWVNLAVGLTGPEGDPFDLIYGAVILTALAGAGLARFEAPGMARAMFAAAAVHVLIIAIALLAGKHHSPVTSVGEIAGGNGVFMLFWIWSALLFRKAAEPSQS